MTAIKISLSCDFITVKLPCNWASVSKVVRVIVVIAAFGSTSQVCRSRHVITAFSELQEFSNSGLQSIMELDPMTAAAVDTRNRLCKVDGRFAVINIICNKISSLTR
jgi:hypothetical protein